MGELSIMIIILISLITIIYFNKIKKSWFINFLNTLVSSANKIFTFCNTLTALNVISEIVPMGVEIRYKAVSILGKLIFNLIFL